MNRGVFMRRASGLIVLVFVLGCGVYSYAQQRLTAANAKDHVGEQATVCGSVADVHYAVHSKGQPTFLNFDNPHPYQTFTIVIFGSDLPNFENPQRKYSGKKVCVTGTIKIFKVAPEIVAHNPSAIELQ
jgi:hypothetical protein